MGIYYKNTDGFFEEALFKAKKKPRWCSDVRWRIELRRRKDERAMRHLNAYALAHTKEGQFDSSRLERIRERTRKCNRERRLREIMMREKREKMNRE